MRLMSSLRRCWMKRGQQKRIPTPGQQQKVHVFGGYNWCDDTLCTIQHPKANSDGFCRFIEHLMLTAYPHQKVVLVMDNARIHTSHLSQAMLSLFDQRLQVVYLPKYCPFLNPIERFWQHLKFLSNSNRLHDSLDALASCIDFHLQQQNDLDFPLRFTFSKHL